MTLTECHFSGNSATGGQADGGGIYSRRYLLLTVNQSTFFGNSAGTDGGGIAHAGSPAIEALNDSPFSTDQCGLPRPVGGLADIGAAEFHGGPDLAPVWNLDLDGDVSADAIIESGRSHVPVVDERSPDSAFYRLILKPALP